MSERRYPRTAAPFRFDVELGKVRELARATRAETGAYETGDAVPPTFLAIASGWWGYSWEEPGNSPLAEEGIDPSKTLHLEERYVFERPLRVGDRLTGELTLEQPEHKVGRRSGPMTIITTHTRFKDAEGRLVATAVQRIAQISSAPKVEPST